MSWSLLLLARASTLWNLLDQALVAAAFLAPPAFWLGRIRDALLILFCFITYAVAPVASFGWLLLSMGMVQSERANGVRFWYLAAFAALVFYDQVSWAWLLVDAFGLG
jgi:hypothetical protein